MSEVDHHSMAERIQKKIHEYKGSSSSSDSENDKPALRNATRKKRLFGRKQPVHTLLGGGKSKKISPFLAVIIQLHLLSLFRVNKFFFLAIKIC